MTQELQENQHIREPTVELAPNNETLAKTQLNLGGEPMSARADPDDLPEARKTLQ